MPEIAGQDRRITCGTERSTGEVPTFESCSIRVRDPDDKPRSSRTPDWDEAIELCAEVLAQTRRVVLVVSTMTRIAVIRARRGQAGVWGYLDEAMTIAAGFPEPATRI